MNERIRKVRKTLKFTQQEFAIRIGMTANSLTNYETGRRNPSSSVINNICKTFNVNEEWLRTGDGTMFAERSRNDEIAAFIADITTDRPDFRMRLVSVLAQLSPAEWTLLEQMALKLAEPEQSPAQVRKAEKTASLEAYKNWLDALPDDQPVPHIPTREEVAAAEAAYVKSFEKTPEQSAGASSSTAATDGAHGKSA